MCTLINVFFKKFSCWEKRGVTQVTLWKVWKTRNKVQEGFENIYKLRRFCLKSYDQITIRKTLKMKKKNEKSTMEAEAMHPRHVEQGAFCHVPHT